MLLPAKNTSPGEIEHIIKQLPIKKSPGHDLISNVITKNLTKKIIIFLLHLFNAIFRLSYFLNTSKYSVVILIPKPNKPPQDPASYRPISLLRTFSKIFEKILLKRLINFAS